MYVYVYIYIYISLFLVSTFPLSLSLSPTLNSSKASWRSTRADHQAPAKGTHSYMCKYIYDYMYIYILMYVFIFMYIYIYACICIHKYISRSFSFSHSLSHTLSLTHTPFFEGLSEEYDPGTPSTCRRYRADMSSDSEEGSYLRLTDLCITQH